MRVRGEGGAPVWWRDEHCAEEEVEEEEGGARREVGGGARERRGACRGEILTRTQINAPSDIKSHLGVVDDRESNFYS